MNLKKFIKNDKRENIRFDINISCIIEDNDIQYNCNIVNISSTGAKIILKEKIDNKKVKIIFSFGEIDFNFFVEIIRSEIDMISVSFLCDKLNKKNIKNVLRLIDIGDDIKTEE